jgi:alanine racemase
LNYSLTTLGEWLEKPTLINAAKHSIISRLSTDSRSGLSGSDTLFIAIKGLHHDGHKYIIQAWNQGIRNFIAQRQIELPGPANWIIVEDSVQALQQIATAHRKQFSIPVLGITGSNGKTIVKEWLNTLIGEDLKLHRSPRSWNSQIGVPLSVWGLEPKHQLGIIEAGISEPDEMQKLEKIIQPTIGLLTNIGSAHDGGFIDRKEKLNQKLSLFSNCEKIIFCADHIAIANGIAQDQKEKAERKCISWSLNNKPADIIAYIDKGLHIQYDELKFTVQIPFPGAAALENLMHAISAALVLGIMPKAISERIEKLAFPQFRLQTASGLNDSLIINDSYSLDLASLESALEFTKSQSGNMPLTCIITDVDQAGDSIYIQIENALLHAGVSRLFIIGDSISKADFSSKIIVERFNSTTELLRDLNQFKFDGQAVLVKGARRFKLERVAARLMAKLHATRLEIDLNALADNLNIYRDALPKDTLITCMVKASGYGAGDIETARVLEFNRADYLGVAYPDEASNLRRAGISLPILVMNSRADQLQQLAEDRAEPVIYNLEILKELLALQGQGITLPFHLEIDTGMKRLGFTEQEVDQLGKLDTSSLQLKSIFSHLAAADDPKHDSFTLDQIAQFDALSLKVMQAFPESAPLRHILNSAGMLRFTTHTFDMVRLGIGLYGYDPTNIIAPKLRPVHRLITTITQIHTLEPGQSTGYGRMGKASRKMQIATIGIGYADGIRRALGNGIGWVAIRGTKAPYFGNICMDMAMIDITDIPTAQAGDEVELFGQKIGLEEIAIWMNTIPYEVLTSVSSRVKRIYFQD